MTFSQFVSSLVKWRSITDVSSHSFSLGFQTDGHSSMKLPRLKREHQLNTHGWGSGRGHPWSWVPKSWLRTYSAFIGRKQPQSKATTFLSRFLMLAKGRQMRVLWLGDGVNEPHASIDKPGALQTRSFVHTKARLAALSPSHVHSGIDRPFLLKNLGEYDS